MTRSSRGKRQLLRVLCGLLLLATPATATAQGVVFDNGAPNNTFGLKIFEPFSAANDFTLGSTTQLLSFDWYALFMGAGGPSTVSASYFWQILTDGGGEPGNVIARGSSSTTGSLTEFGCCYPQPWEAEGYRFTSSLGGTTLGAGTYWLAISGFSSNVETSYYWANSVYGYGNESKRYTGTDWETYAAEGAFTITGQPGTNVNIAPEPATLTLLGTGMIALAGAARRRRSKVPTGS